MMLRRHLACLVLGLFATAAGTTAGDVYEVDPVHSSVMFSVKHSDINSVYGIFADISGTFSVDGQGSFEVAVGVESVLSGNEGRDRHLKSPDFFSARQFPKIVFKSKQVKSIGDNKLEVIGEVTMRGVTKAATATLTTATGKGRGGEDRGGVEGVFKVKRSDFKVGGPGGLGDEVTVMISLQGVKK